LTITNVSIEELEKLRHFDETFENLVFHELEKVYSLFFFLINLRFTANFLPLLALVDVSVLRVQVRRDCETMEIVQGQYDHSQQQALRSEI
jgi:hypothetical protein